MTGPSSRFDDGRVAEGQSGNDGNEEDYDCDYYHYDYYNYDYYNYDCDDENDGDYEDEAEDHDNHGYDHDHNKQQEVAQGNDDGDGNDDVEELDDEFEYVVTDMQGHLWFQPWALPKLRRQNNILDWHSRHEAYEPLWADSEIEDAYCMAIEKVSDFNNLPLWSGVSSMENDVVNDDIDFDLHLDKNVYTTTDVRSFEEAQKKFSFIRRHLSDVYEVNRFLRSASPSSVEIFKKITQGYDIVLLSPATRNRSNTFHYRDVVFQEALEFMSTLPDEVQSQAKTKMAKIQSDLEYTDEISKHVVQAMQYHEAITDHSRRNLDNVVSFTRQTISRNGFSSLYPTVKYTALPAQDIQFPTHTTSSASENKGGERKSDASPLLGPSNFESFHEWLEYYIKKSI
ncbi:hypothetical protein EDB82DRAFT_533668 [Fusarium venenatum]|uniref:uncharacterized protein n=1 Tax=Fusarium venenatum TaxID=56646 RepID=UPI001DD5539D|nr:hypothetical protein EDB82DRAFT_533668 [Fusarium venenatum]